MNLPKNYMTNYVGDCDHPSLRNELEVEPTNIMHTGKPEPWGGFYATVTCPDCETELRIKAVVTETWPSDWMVVNGTPRQPKRDE